MPRSSAARKAKKTFSLSRQSVMYLESDSSSANTASLVSSLEPRGISAPRVPEFVRGRLLSKSRRLPIVLVSRTAVFDKWLVDPAELADRLAGIAEVNVLDDKWAGYALSDEV